MHTHYPCLENPLLTAPQLPLHCSSGTISFRKPSLIPRRSLSPHHPQLRISHLCDRFLFSPTLGFLMGNSGLGFAQHCARSTCPGPSTHRTLRRDHRDKAVQRNLMPPLSACIHGQRTSHSWVGEATVGQKGLTGTSSSDSGGTSLRCYMLSVG